MACLLGGPVPRRDRRPFRWAGPAGVVEEHSVSRCRPSATTRRRLSLMLAGLAVFVLVRYLPAFSGAVGQGLDRCGVPRRSDVLPGRLSSSTSRSSSRSHSSCGPVLCGPPGGHQACTASWAGSPWFPLGHRHGRGNARPRRPKRLGVDPAPADHGHARVLGGGWQCPGSSRAGTHVGTRLDSGKRRPNSRDRSRHGPKTPLHPAPEACNRSTDGGDAAGPSPAHRGTGVATTRTPMSTVAPAVRPRRAGPIETVRQERASRGSRPKVPAVTFLVPCRTFAVPTSLGPSRKERSMAARSNLPIVLGVDTVTVEGRTLRWAAEQAHLEGHRLQLVTAAGPAFPVPRDHGRGSLLVGSTRLNLRGGPGLGSRGATSDLAVRRGRRDVPSRGSEHTAHPARQPAHLVVLGSRGRGSLRSHVLGSVALAVVRHAACRWSSTARSRD